VSLEELRKQIDQFDSQLVELLNARAQIVVEVGKHKSKTAGAIYAPDREKAVLKKIIEENKGPLPNKTLIAIWRELMSGSFHLENPLRIAYLGPQGSFSHSAAMLKFGQSVEYEAVTDIRSIFDEVAKGHSDLGIVPIENSAGGPVNESLDAFMEQTAPSTRSKNYIPSRKSSHSAESGLALPLRTQIRSPSLHLPKRYKWQPRNQTPAQ